MKPHFRKFYTDLLIISHWPEFNDIVIHGEGNIKPMNVIFSLGGKLPTRIDVGKEERENGYWEANSYLCHSYQFHS